MSVSERLFEDFKYFDYKFPEPQYLGAKYVILDWIRQFIPQGVKSVLDAFGGSQSVSFLFKQFGFKTITNDFLNFNYQIGKALIENPSEKLTEDDLLVLFQESPDKSDFTLIERLFTNIFFEKEQAFFLDNFRANIPLLANDYKKALAFTVICRSITRKITMGHFAHTQALSYSNNPERIRRNRSLIRPVKDIFCELLPSYNNAVFDNLQENVSYHKNVLDLLLEVQHVDLVYFDPPYCNSHADYQSFYHLLETYTEYWKDKKFINGINRYEPQRESGFDKKGIVVESFEKLFELAEGIPHWLISYNDRSYPAIDKFEQLLKKYREVRIETKTYHNGRGGKGSVAGSREILFVCSPKINVSIKKTMKSFEDWSELHQRDTLGEFNTDRSGLLWLKIKSILRKDLIKNFVTLSQCCLSATGLNAQFKELYGLLSVDLDAAHRLLDDYTRQVRRSQIESVDEQKLVSELYKLKTFDWGGDYQNSLDKYLVSRYIKVDNPSYDNLLAKFETEINPAVQGYVLNSWYNYWSSVLIENVFRSHPVILPAIGKIKNVDFFVNDIPFDLKVTYLPAEYIKQKRKEKGLPVELTFLKAQAKAIGILYDKHAKPNDMYYEITEKMKDRNDDAGRNVLTQIQEETLSILQDAQKQPKMLTKWLYENQGTMRFGAENRLFLVLVDTNNRVDSWKLKRNIDLLKPVIVSYLDHFTERNIKDLDLSFSFKGRSKSFNVLADIIFIVK